MIDKRHTIDYETNGQGEISKVISTVKSPLMNDKPHYCDPPIDIWSEPNFNLTSYLKSDEYKKRCDRFRKENPNRPFYRSIQDSIVWREVERSYGIPQWSDYMLDGMMHDKE